MNTYDVDQVGYVYKRAEREWIAKLYEDRRFWGPFTTRREAIGEVRIQASSLPPR